MENTKKETTKKGNTQETLQKPQETLQGKETKRDYTWQEITNIRGNSPTVTREGNIMETLTGENLTVQIKTIAKTLSGKWDIFTNGYHQPLKESSFQKVYGISWETWEAEIFGKKGKANGEIITLSTGDRGNHYLVINPFKPFNVKDLNGNNKEINKDNFLNFFQHFSNHGRIYKVSKILSKQYNLLYVPQGIGDGRGYHRSNNYNLNFQQRGNSWVIGTGKGNYREIPNPWEILEIRLKEGKLDIING